MRSQLENPPTPESRPSSPVATGASQPPNGNGNNGGGGHYDGIGYDGRKGSGKPIAIYVADLPSRRIPEPIEARMSWARVAWRRLYRDTIDPQGNFYITWLALVSVAFLYNGWVIPLRSSFLVQTPENQDVWLMWDLCADLVNVIDLLCVKHRLMYLYEGFFVRDRRLTGKNYVRKMQFKVSVAC